MRARVIVLLFGAVCMLGLVGAAFADTDTAGDELVSGVDIVEHDLYVYDSVNGDGRYMRLEVDMNSTVPGLLQLDLDVDNDEGTGSSSGGMIGMFNPCTGGGPLKVQAGTDIWVIVTLRTQTDDASSSWCTDCIGSDVTCMTKGDACGETDCYEAGINCAPGTAECYKLDTPCAEEHCYLMNATTECTTDESCAKGMLIGEWYAIDVKGNPSNANAAGKGRIMMPLPTEGGTTGDVVVHFPLEMIIDGVIADNAGYDFDTDKAKITSNLRYQVSAWHNASKADDFINVSPLCLYVSDVSPNAGQASAIDGCVGFCAPDVDLDGQVGLFDLIKMKNGYGTGGCTQGWVGCTP